ncbi:hypothetical protein [Streptomyces sp. NBC_00691]|uniref:hypothetical protein n=1 Tax=Streptomyces sp. NBC_00691 TaxID=2903671 RepID=UPI002E314CB8|nr:hypothetical protein [Streptomyces sp. NBC_00691]
MLEHWYFCAALGLPPQSAAIQLDLLAALQEPVETDRSEEIVSLAVEGLARAGTVTALYALPHVLSAQRRFAGVTEVAARAAAYYRSIASVAPEHLRARLGAALRASAGPEVALAVVALGELLDDAGDSTAEADTSIVPYHDLVEQLAPTTALVIARFLAGRDPRAVGELLDERPSLIEAALRGDHGRLALLQAAETVAMVRPEATDRIRTALAVVSRGAFDMEPDLLATAARVSFALSGGIAGPDASRGSGTLDAVEHEALTGESLFGWLKAWTDDGLLPPTDCEARELAYRRLGGVGSARDSAMPSVLWQSALWSVAAEYAPRPTVERLARWWQAPDPSGRTGDPGARHRAHASPTVTLPYRSYDFVLRHTYRLSSLRYPAGQNPTPLFTTGPAGETDAGTAAWLWSPWLLHHTPPSPPKAPRHRPGTAAQATQAAPATQAPTPKLWGDQPEQLVRLLGAGLIAGRLLTGAAPDEACRTAEGGASGHRDHLLVLLVHVRDTLYRTFSALMDVVHGKPHQAQLYAGHLSSLLLHTASVADSIGKGARAGVHPAEIVRVVAALAGPPSSPPYPPLPDWGARGVALHWAQEASAGGTGPHRTEAGGRWFTGDRPPADTLLSLIRERETLRHSARAIRATQLHRDLHAHSRYDVLRWDWTPEGPRTGDGVLLTHLAPGALALSGPVDPSRDSFSVEEWREMAQGVTDFLTETDKYAITPVTVGTLRLAALLGRPDLGDEGAFQDWVSEWSGRVTSLNTAAHLPRYVRARMFDMFRSPTGSAGSQERLMQVLEHVVDVIVDLSGAAQFYYDRLFEELTAHGLPPEMANRLRVRTLRAVYHKWGGNPPVVTHGSPWSTYLSQVSGRGTEAALVRFLRATAAEELQGQGMTLDEVMSSLWNRTQRPARLPASRQPSGRSDGDRRFVEAVVRARHAGEIVEYRRNENSGVGMSRSARPYVHDLFRDGPGVRPHEQGAYVLGFVSSPPRRGNQPTLQVNCGMDQLAQVRLEAHETRNWELGEPVAVRLGAPADPKSWSVTRLAPLPQHDGEVREAELARTEGFPWLALTVDGVATDAYPRGGGEKDVMARRRWDPDLSRAFGDRGTTARPSETLVRWHRELNHWVPVDAGLPELAVAAGAADGGRATPVRLVLSGVANERSGFGTARRFVTEPGRCYVLGPSAWDPEDRGRVEEECLAAPAGLILHAEFRPGENRLRLAPERPFDRRNVQWLGIFDHVNGPRDPAGDEDEDQTRDRPAHEEAFLRSDAAGRPEWRIDVPAVEGFPSWVRAEFVGATPRTSHVVCSVESWDDTAARRPEVTVQPFEEEGIREEKPTPELYAWFSKVPTHTVVDLVWATRKAFVAVNTAATKEGLRGRITTESLTLSGHFPFLSRTSPRRAVVTSDYAVPPYADHRREPTTALSAAQLASHCVPPCDPAPLDAPSLDGLVVARTKEGGHVRAWFDLGTHIAVAVLPVGCLDVEAPSVGDHLVGARTPDGWVFQVHRRLLHLEALWEWAETPGSDWKAVGHTRGNDGTSLLVRQDVSGRPRLATAPADDGLGTSGRAGARRGGKKRNDGSFPVVVQHEGTYRVGHTTGIELVTEFRPVHVEQEVVDVWDVRTPAPPGPTGVDDTRYVRVRRRFDLSPVGSARPWETAGVPQVQDPAAAWQQLLELPDLALTGRLVDDDHLELTVCAAPDSEGVYRPWLELLDEPWAWVGGRNYPTELVRASPVPNGAGYAGSFLRAAPLSVAEFMTTFVPYATPDGRRCDFREPRHTRGALFYVGIEENDAGLAARFEFGHGWFVDIPVEALVVGGEPLDPDGLALFHGDRIQAMAFLADENTASGGLVVHIELADISKGVEWQVHTEATTADVVHLLELTVDRDRGRVTVHRVLTRTRELGRGAEEDTHAKEQPVSARIEARDALALLASLESGSQRRLMLGRLVPEAIGRHRRALRFATVAPYATADGGAGLRKHDRLYLEAGVIHETHNDFLLRFGLPEELHQEGDPLAVVVPRRDFSHRESCLRRAAKTEGLAAYRGRARMLVRLGNHNEVPGQSANHWHGSTKSPPARSTETLRGHLRRRPQGCFGVVDSGGLQIELRPGVVFALSGLRVTHGIVPGSVVRLTLDAADDILVHQAIPADISYLDDRPRPAVVFPKDSLKTAEDIRNADAYGRFTVAGLPGLSATAQRGTGAALLHTEHPKIAGVIRKALPRAQTQLVPMDDPRAGILAFDADAPTEGVLVRPVGVPTGPEPVAARRVAWAQLSFQDAPARQIAEACEKGGWRYHDSRTQTWPTNGDAPHRRGLPATARAVAEPVFFSPKGAGWTLRHDSNSLRQHGFPATELLEETFQDLSGGRRTLWAVARTEGRSVWLELTPGRVAEVRGELVRFSDGHSLADLDWSRLAPGDLLYGHVDGGVNECGHLVLEDWQPGLRGSLRPRGRSRVLLPVTRTDDVAGALHLGEGEAEFPYPAERELIERCPVGSSAWLDQANDVIPATPDSVRAGDVVLLAADAAGGGLRVAGLQRARVQLAPLAKDHWFHTQWLRDDLAAAAGTGSTVLQQLGVLPVTVEAVEDGPEPVVTVSRRHQPGGVWPDGTVLARPVADLGNGFVVMHNGAALVRVHVETLLPGLPPEATAATATALVADRRLLRLHWDRSTRTLRSGLPTGGTGLDETVVQALFAVDGPDGDCLGVLCRDERSQALCWLPARDAAWTTGVPGELLATRLRAARQLTVLRRDRCQVSLVHHPLVAREYENLTPGQLVRVTVVGEGAAATKHSANPLLVAVAPLGLLAQYARGRTVRGPGDDMMAEVARLERIADRGIVRLVEPGFRRTVVDLPEWLCERLKKLSLRTFAERPRPVKDLVPIWFGKYRNAYRAGIEGEPTPTGTSAGRKVIWSLGALEHASGEEHVEARRTATAAVAEWLCSDVGRPIVLQEDAAVDLAPVLAACRIGAMLPPGAGQLPYGWQAFLLARVGDRAVCSLHTESLVTEWLTRPERHVLDGDWRRLRSLYLTRELSFGQVASVEDFARAVMERPAGMPQSETGRVGRALLAAVGRLPSAEHLVQDAPLLHRLARLGVSLTPPAGSAVPRWQPTREQYLVLQSVFQAVVPTGLPITLLPAHVPLPETGARYGETLLKEAAAHLMRP